MSDQALPVPHADGAIRIDPAFDTPRRIALAVFCVVAALDTVALARGRRPRVISAAGGAAAAAALLCGAPGGGGGAPFPGPPPPPLVVLAIVPRGGFAAMILRHRDPGD